MTMQPSASQYDECNAVERLQPTGACDASMYLHFQNTLTDICDVQRQRAYELAIDPRHDSGAHLRACMSLLSLFYYPSFMEEGGTWEPYEEFFAIFPKNVPICYGAKRGNLISLSGLLKGCADWIRLHVKQMCSWEPAPAEEAKTEE